MKKSVFRRILLVGGVAGVALTAMFLPAVPPPAPDAKTEATNTINTNAASHTLAAKEAGAAWAELEDASRPPTPPDEWQLKEPSHEEQARFLMPYVLILADKARDFYSRFPADTNALAARQREFGILSWAVDNGVTNQQARLDAAEKAILADPKLAEEDRFGIRNHAVERSVHARESEGDAAMLAEFEKGARMLQKEFPKRPEVTAMLLQVAENSDPEKSRAVLKEIAASDAAAELKDAAAEMGKELERVGNPFPLKFTAVDGREVDLAKMQGKVVLVDFWATWCEQCMEMLPAVKETYGKLHAKGFEIVGINLDQEEQSLTNLVAAQKLDWPEYFDGLYWQTKFAVQFDVKDLPAMWLVDKKGILRYINAGFDLNKKIDHLLAE